MDSPEKPEHPFSVMFSMRKLIGKGSVSEVFECEHRETKKRYAAKFELINKRGPQQLDRELALYKKMSGFNEVCKVHWTGEYDEYRVAVMDLLDKSLQDRMADCPNGLSLKTVLMLADQMIRRVELLHNMGYIHRDIKPDNFAPGLDSAASTLYLIDYGIAKRYVDNHGNHIPFRERCPAAGTLRYISINGHLGLEQSRRDDMESIGYVLLYLLRGSLPWQGIQAASPREKCMKVAEKKIQTSPDILFAGFPPEFAEYILQTISYFFNIRRKSKSFYLTLITLLVYSLPKFRSSFLAALKRDQLDNGLYLEQGLFFKKTSYISLTSSFTVEEKCPLVQITRTLLDETIDGWDLMNPATGSTIPAEAVGDVYIFVCGPGNYIEYTGLMDYASKKISENIEITYGCTCMQRQEEYLSELMELGD